MSKKIILVSNRLPITVRKSENKFVFDHNAGGLASGLNSIQKNTGSVWVGWPGTYFSKRRLNNAATLEKKLVNELKYYPIFLSKTEIDEYYRGFCNSTIWPLFHYFTKTATYDRGFWESYKKVNEIFCGKILKIAGKNDIIWIHDYHLMLLPQLLRERLPEAKIGFFLHIPFPAFEVYRLLPQRSEILQGLLGADLIGFHTAEYTRHFLTSVYRLLGLDYSLGQINTNGRLVKADSFPLGIDYQKIQGGLKESIVQKKARVFKGETGNRKIILSVDRLDYTKGILERLQAFSEFLEKYPARRKQVVLVMVAAPSRQEINEYWKLKKEVEKLVKNINSKYGDRQWTPVWYLHQTLNRNELLALYSLADVCLVTPLRDGMNLVSKEYVAARRDKKGVLILSEMAGAAEELTEALIINPSNKDEVVEAIEAALKMPIKEQQERNKIMQKKLGHYSEKWWTNRYLSSLSKIKNDQKNLQAKLLTKLKRKTLYEDFHKSKRRLLILDYDGTLVHFANTPWQARPDKTLLDLLERISSDSKNDLVILSGRDKDTLDKWFGKLKMTLVAEHGIWIKKQKQNWKSRIEPPAFWKTEIRQVLVFFVDRTPGSLIEEKTHSLVWHYRGAEPILSRIRCEELTETLREITPAFNLQVLEGSKIVEIKNADINKGRAIFELLESAKWDFILVFGDDRTDEDMFNALPTTAYSIKIGLSQTRAKYSVRMVEDVRKLLSDLAGKSHV